MKVAAELRAVTREMDPAHDALGTLGPDSTAWLHDGLHLVADGIAAMVPASVARERLQAVDVDDPLGLPGTGALALGALPFDPHADGMLVIPSRVAGQGAGRAWVTEIGPPVPPRRQETRPATRFSIASRQSRLAWEEKVRAVLDAIHTGDVEKVVLAREVLVESDVDFDIPALVRRLLVQQPGCFVYSTRGLVGASPELLIRRRGDRIESRPMAGTAVTNGRADALSALAASAKDGREHRLVVDAIEAALAPLCSELRVAETPDVAVFGTVAHLATPIVGRAADPSLDALALAQRLHPTPAVGGTPGPAALAAISGNARGSASRGASNLALFSSRPCRSAWLRAIPAVTDSTCVAISA